jgi:hypothetical protein
LPLIIFEKTSFSLRQAWQAWQARKTFAKRSRCMGMSNDASVFHCVSFDGYAL